MVFCNTAERYAMDCRIEVTILILVDGFLQSLLEVLILLKEKSHNPYFSRWFSAITLANATSDNTNSHNPYFSRWFSAIIILIYLKTP